MKFFEKFRKKEDGTQHSQVDSQPAIEPASNTAVTIFFDRSDLEKEEIEKIITEKFGVTSVRSIDSSHPSVTHFMLQIDKIDVVCSYMPFPYPKEECDIPTLFRFNIYITEEEQKALAEHKSFCVLAEIGGGKTLEGKRLVCQMLTKLCGSLLHIKGASGVYYSAANLLLGKKMYLNYVAISEREENNTAYFPSMLWILVYQTRADDGASAIETCGLAQFGFLELRFYKPEEEWANSFEKLYIMSTLQITGKEIYKNMDTISFSKDTFAVFKQDGAKLSVIGGI